MPRYTEEEARAAIAASESYSDALRRLGLGVTGGNSRVLRRRAERWRISTTHFDPWAASRRYLRRTPIPLDEVLVSASRYSRSQLKRRLYSIAETSWVAVGRKYGVSDNAIRKWVRQYEREAAAVEGARVA
jgi:transposase-like protein